VVSALRSARLRASQAAGIEDSSPRADLIHRPNAQGPNHDGSAPVQISNSIGMKLVSSPPRFQMGAPNDDTDAEPEDNPVIRYGSAAFLSLGCYRVTPGAVSRRSLTRPGPRTNPRRTAREVRWND